MDRHFKRLVLIPATFIFGAALPLYSVIVYAVDSKTPKGQPDFTPLGLKVTDVEIVDEIAGESLGQAATIKAQKNYKLVVITLEGQEESDNYYTFGNNPFAVFYSRQDDNFGNFISCCAFKINSKWSIPPKTGTLTSVQLIKAGPVKLKVAANVPNDIKSCTVVIPAVASGQAVIPSLVKADSQKTTDGQ